MYEAIVFLPLLGAILAGAIKTLTTAQMQSLTVAEITAASSATVGAAAVSAEPQP